MSKKQSILAGGLVSSAGILISKILGLIYVVPFNEILGSAANNAYYSASYNIYSYVLNIATAGLPFAISTLIARYYAREDYKMCLLVKKISFYTMATLGFIFMVLMILFASPIANSICPSDGDVQTMKNVIIIISFALFVIPILASVRGFFNGLKEMEIYSASQIIEQIVRILFLLSAGSIAVFVFQTERVWAVYFGVFAATIAGVITIYYVNYKGKNTKKEVENLAKAQGGEPTHDSIYIFKELIIIAIPFLLNAMFGYCDTIINQFDLKPGLEAFGNTTYNAAISSAIFYKATKVIAIPMILAPGFSAAIIPYITTAIENKDFSLVRRHILDCVDTVLYIAFPICFAIFIFAQPINVVLFGGGDTLDVDTYVLGWYAIEAFCATVAPIFASIVMAIGERKKVVYNTMFFAIIKLLTNRIFISIFGIPGVVLSSLLAYIIFAILNIRIIQKTAKIKWKYTFRKVIIMISGLVGFYLFSLIFKFTGLLGYKENRIICLFILCLMGLVCCLIYFIITAYFSVPQTIFKFEFSDIKDKIKGRLKR